MKTAEEYLRKAGNGIISKSVCIEAINIARKEAIEECARRATATADYGRFTGDAQVNQYSILSIINELK